MELFSPKKLLQALLCSYLLSAVLLLATAFFLYRFRLKESQIRLAVAVIYVLSGALAGFFFARTTGKRRFFCGLAAGLSYFLILGSSLFLSRERIHCVHATSSDHHGDVYRRRHIRSSHQLTAFIFLILSRFFLFLLFRKNDLHPVDPVLVHLSHHKADSVNGNLLALFWQMV